MCLCRYVKNKDKFSTESASLWQRGVCHLLDIELTVASSEVNVLMNKAEVGRESPCSQSPLSLSIRRNIVFRNGNILRIKYGEPR